MSLQAVHHNVRNRLTIGIVILFISNLTKLVFETDIASEEITEIMKCMALALLSTPHTIECNMLPYACPDARRDMYSSVEYL
jgi:hypothetical protein